MKTRINKRKRKGRRTKGKSSNLKAEEQEPFHFFPKLPTEIRTRIWQMTIEEGRIVEIYSVTNKGLRAPIPPILHACAESRVIGLKNYELAFSGGINERCPARIFFNFHYDTLYFHTHWNYNVEGYWGCTASIQSLVTNDIQRVQSVCFDIKTNGCVPTGHRDHGPRLCGWDSLRSFYLVLKKDPKRQPHSLQNFRTIKSTEYPDYKKYGKGRLSSHMMSYTSDDGPEIFEQLKFQEVRTYLHRYDECRYLKRESCYFVRTVD